MQERIGFVLVFALVAGVSLLFVGTSLPSLVIELGTRSSLVAAIWVPLAFVAWCWPLLRGEPWLPIRSLVLGAVVFVLSCWTWNSDLHSAWRYREHADIFVSAGANIFAAAALTAVAISFRRRHSARGGLVFHAILFGWIGSFAIPYLGQYP